MDPVAQAIATAFELLLVAITFLLAVAYFSFFRMDLPIRRARMFIMSDRVQRFLLAFFVGFLSLVVSFLGSLGGFALPAFVSTGVVFFFLGSVVYGSLELFLIARPPAGGRLRAKGQAAKAEATRGGPDEGG
jgi:hypothetical protein